MRESTPNVMDVTAGVEISETKDKVPCKKIYSYTWNCVKPYHIPDAHRDMYLISGGKPACCSILLQDSSYAGHVLKFRRRVCMLQYTSSRQFLCIYQMVCRIYSVLCFIFLCILFSAVECSERTKNGGCPYLYRNDLVDTQGNTVVSGSSYILKALKHGLVIGPPGAFGEARLVLLDRVNSTSSITVIPQLINDYQPFALQLADANPPLYLADVQDTLMFDTPKSPLWFLPNKGANNFNIGRQTTLNYGGSIGSKCYQKLMGTLTNCKQCEIDKRNPETTYFTLTKVGN
ncbi:uncharacterized protein BX664DRAFT_388919 [Halteromyces radiatus]|uniref:uncharacterized protein n=1 Tax=Halteromyces radiatus TaxID=101107 RepID=UPI002220C088|nr:uncharacterized protein BX664DRAFT_388919 [Halteromyces radiatus]KAI8079971.1 hypothetical protein BX664DRAFT_388919 [Halteromyces radiatus]